MTTKKSDKRSPLEKEFQFYLDNQAGLAKKYLGKYIVIKEGKVIGAFESEIEALEKTATEHEVGTFLVQKCEPGKDSYTQTYHSRVAFCPR